MVQEEIIKPKVDINSSLVRKLVDAQFPEWANLPVKSVEFDGHDNRTFHLGDTMSVRLPSAECYAGQVIKEHKWLPRLSLQLPLPIPVPIALGNPTQDYPWRWSVNQWLEGENARIEGIGDLNLFALSLANFLADLHTIDTTGGPLPGKHNFFRGGPLATYDAETRRTIELLQDTIDADCAIAVWETALESKWQENPVWVHGDFSADNLLVQLGRLSAIIDWGGLGIGDPACDLTIAWTLLYGKSLASFHKALPLDKETWERGRGWALWKGLITLRDSIDSNPRVAESAHRVLGDVIAEHKILI
ncbi:MAG: aminoglycoside phosphotransferase family protein [Candidatus Marinimicrobia bacterium]|nr:aminoglycoside phosphotransferase family protein [Candidatus Neomarinimicrobiota bacterium]MBT3575334.1 aminoglycoside phosphotransferase family protein [Candidatus Neomarinimicrobiota bacterium]MBT3680751.1 aminoglycoside phosphotransferase family protein [Candidatus Neomarinimicrobiota bacterium]MBT3950105.1 aminoglycoside phosphotransferase family protein [Candidatus Neomarinimicrobiota bacterium]MBT4253765.1 aminoglycoside phosphotransferase family protein [Candidatus Neomarinimicrobiota